MRITIAVEHQGVGAAETYAFDLAARAADEGETVEVLVHPMVRQAATARVGGSPVEVVVFPRGTVSRYRFARARFASNQPPDVVHVNHAVSPVLIAARDAGVGSRFVTDHVLPLRPRYGLTGRALERLTRSAATDLVVFSRQNARFARWSWGQVPTHVIPAGVPEPACPSDVTGTRSSLGLAPDAFVATSVGRLTGQKRMDVFLRAVANLLPTHPNLRALVVGGGEDRRSLEALANDLGIADAVLFTGHRDDVGC